LPSFNFFQTWNDGYITELGTAHINARDFPATGANITVSSFGLDPAEPYRCHFFSTDTDGLTVTAEL
ncbi:unnamed protein product, partial [Chrysoparadoxa australica]